MSGNVGILLYDGILFSIQLFTGLLLGYSLVGIHPVNSTKVIAPVSLLAGLMYATLTIFISGLYPFFVVAVLIVPILYLIMKIPLTQILVAILLSMLFQLLFISLLEYNLLGLLMEMSGIKVDFGSNLSADLLVSMNNILISIFIYSKAPTLFPPTLFEEQISEDESELSFNGHIFFVILMLVLLSAGVIYTAIELDQIRIHYRLFITFWMIAISLSSIFFMRRIILHKNESIQNFLDKQYQKELLSFFQIVRSQRHDFNFHLTALYGMIQKGEYEASKTYIEEMTKSAASINDLLPLHHPAVAAMLSTFKGIAQKKKITIDFILRDDMKDMPCSVYEMNKMLGNLLQNAIDEVEKLKEVLRNIVVEISKERNYIIIRVTNNANLQNEGVRDLFAIGYSTKPLHEGLGLPTVKKIAEKYNGIVYPEISDDVITFQIQLPIQ